MNEAKLTQEKSHSVTKIAAMDRDSENPLGKIINELKNVNENEIGKQYDAYLKDHNIAFMSPDDLFTQNWQLPFEAVYSMSCQLQTLLQTYSQQWKLPTSTIRNILKYFLALSKNSPPNVGKVVVDPLMTSLGDSLERMIKKNYRKLILLCNGGLDSERENGKEKLNFKKNLHTLYNMLQLILKILQSFQDNITDKSMIENYQTISVFRFVRLLQPLLALETNNLRTAFNHIASHSETDSMGSMQSANEGVINTTLIRDNQLLNAKNSDCEKIKMTTLLIINLLQKVFVNAFFGNAEFLINLYGVETMNGKVATIYDLWVHDTSCRQHLMPIFAEILLNRMIKKWPFEFESDKLHASKISMAAKCTTRDIKKVINYFRMMIAMDVRAAPPILKILGNAVAEFPWSKFTLSFQWDYFSPINFVLFYLDSNIELLFFPTAGRGSGEQNDHSHSNERKNIIQLWNSVLQIFQKTLDSPIISRQIFFYDESQLASQKTRKPYTIAYIFHQVLNKIFFYTLSVSAQKDKRINKDVVERKEDKKIPNSNNNETELKGEKKDKQCVKEDKFEIDASLHKLLMDSINYVYKMAAFDVDTYVNNLQLMQMLFLFLELHHRFSPPSLYIPIFCGCIKIATLFASRCSKQEGEYFLTIKSPLTLDTLIDDVVAAVRIRSYSERNEQEATPLRDSAEKHPTSRDMDLKSHDNRLNQITYCGIDLMFISLVAQLLTNEFNHRVLASLGENENESHAFISSILLFVMHMDKLDIFDNFADTLFFPILMQRVRKVMHSGTSTIIEELEDQWLHQRSSELWSTAIDLGENIHICETAISKIFKWLTISPSYRDRYLPLLLYLIRYENSVEIHATLLNGLADLAVELCPDTQLHSFLSASNHHSEVDESESRSKRDNKKEALTENYEERKITVSWCDAACDMDALLGIPFSAKKGEFELSIIKLILSFVEQQQMPPGLLMEFQEGAHGWWEHERWACASIRALTRLFMATPSEYINRNITDPIFRILQSNFRPSSLMKLERNILKSLSALCCFLLQKEFLMPFFFDLVTPMLPQFIMILEGKTSFFTCELFNGSYLRDLKKVPPVPLEDYFLVTKRKVSANVMNTFTKRHKRRWNEEKKFLLLLLEFLYFLMRISCKHFSSIDYTDDIGQGEEEEESKEEMELFKSDKEMGNPEFFFEFWQQGSILGHVQHIMFNVLFIFYFLQQHQQSCPITIPRLKRFQAYYKQLKTRLEPSCPNGPNDFISLWIESFFEFLTSAYDTIALNQ